MTGEIRVRRAYLQFFLARVTVYEHEIKLEGHKDLLAKAYGRDWQSAAITAKGGGVAVLSQVDRWWSEGESNHRSLAQDR
jgi:hypothetical protein